MPANLVDVNQFDEPITVPSDGDSLNAASVITALQGLANRTRRLMNVLQGTEQVLDPQNRVVAFSPFAFDNPGIDSARAEWRSAPGQTYLEAFGTSGPKLYLDIGDVLPHGAILFRARALVTLGSSYSATEGMQLTLESETHNFAAPALGSTVAEFTMVEQLTAGLQKIDSGVVNVTVDSAKLYRLGVRAGNVSPSSEDRFHGIELSFTDPGPRSF